MPGWDLYPVREAFVDGYDAPVFVDNDVNIMALGEHRYGLGRGVENMLFATISKLAARPSRRNDAACSVVLATLSHPRTGGP
jgi:ROK family